MTQLLNDLAKELNFLQQSLRQNLFLDDVPLINRDHGSLWLSIVQPLAERAGRSAGWGSATAAAVPVHIHWRSRK